MFLFKTILFNFGLSLTKNTRYFYKKSLNQCVQRTQHKLQN